MHSVYVQVKLPIHMTLNSCDNYCIQKFILLKPNLYIRLLLVHMLFFYLFQCLYITEFALLFGSDPKLIYKALIY